MGWAMLTRLPLVSVNETYCPTPGISIGSPSTCPPASATFVGPLLRSAIPEQSANAGANNVVILGALAYSSDFSQWVALANNIPTLASRLNGLSIANVAASSHSYDFNSRRGLQAAPEEVREPPEHAGARRSAPRLRAIAHREVGDERRGEVDANAGVGPLLEPRWHRRKQQHHAEELGPRELYPEVGREAEVGERLRHLRQTQLRVGGEAHLHAEERGDDPIDDGLGFGGWSWRRRGPASAGSVPWGSPSH